MTYLCATGHSDLWHSIERDRDLVGLAATPLFLRMLSHAFGKISSEERSRLIDRSGTFEYLFSSYVSEMLTRGRSRLKPEWPHPTQAKHWLAWLARTLYEHASTEFYLEDIQPTWLSSGAERRLYSIAVATFTGAAIGLATGIIVGVNEGVQAGLTTGLVWAVAVGAFVRSRTDARHRIRPIETVRWSGSRVGQGLRTGLLTGFAVGASLTMFRHLFLWVWNLAGGDLHAFPRWLVPVEWTDPLVSWVWYGLSRFYNTDELPWVVNLFVFGLSIFDVLAPIILCGLLGSAVGALVTGLTGPEIATKATPNQGIRESAHNSAKFAVAGAVLGGAIILTGHSLSGYSGEIMYDLMMGATIGAIASGFVPALACIQHYAIRLILVVQGKAPWSYGRFLIYCRERMILQQVGGRFSFFHVLLQVYFMEMKAHDVDISRIINEDGSLRVGLITQQVRGDHQ